MPIARRRKWAREGKESPELLGWDELQAWGTEGIAVGFSGGSDSSALLWALVQRRAEGRLSVPLVAIHVHHGLLPEADAWAMRASSRCAEWGVPFAVIRVKVDRALARRVGKEGAARVARYRALAQGVEMWFGGENRVRPRRVVVALAHHLDDRVETFWFRLLRGTGVAGLAPFSVWGPFPYLPPAGEIELRVWRPLVGSRRTELRAWLREAGVDWVEDPTNGEMEGRGWIRHGLLPLVRQVVPAVDRVTVRTIEAMEEAAACLADLARTDREAIAHRAGGWSRERFLALPRYRQVNLVRAELLSAGLLPPTAARLAEMVRQLAESDRRPWSFWLTPEVQWQARRDRLWWTRKGEETVGEEQEEGGGEEGERRRRLEGDGGRRARNGEEFVEGSCEELFSTGDEVGVGSRCLFLNVGEESRGGVRGDNPSQTGGKHATKGVVVGLP
ncbi:MAG: tRNA lysidine(34) synthetase TilS [Hydrogenophilus sp.]|nr:tRNA lysidine(34) synthetase TilS [Hydrogenophilus sp.]